MTKPKPRPRAAAKPRLIMGRPDAFWFGFAWGYVISFAVAMAAALLLGVFK